MLQYLFGSKVVEGYFIQREKADFPDRFHRKISFVFSLPPEWPNIKISSCVHVRREPILMTLKGQEKGGGKGTDDLKNGYEGIQDSSAGSVEKNEGGKNENI